MTPKKLAEPLENRGLFKDTKPQHFCPVFPARKPKVPVKEEALSARQVPWTKESAREDGSLFLFINKGLNGFAKGYVCMTSKVIFS